MVCRGRADFSKQSDGEMITFLTQVSKIGQNRITNSQLRCVLEYVYVFFKFDLPCHWSQHKLIGSEAHRHFLLDKATGRPNCSVKGFES